MLLLSRDYRNAPWRIVITFAILAGCADPAAGPIPLTVREQAGSNDLALADLAGLTDCVRSAYVLVRIVDGTDSGARRHDGRSTVVNGASGVIIDPGGFVLTAAHVAVDTAFAAEVTTLNGRVHHARIISVDRGSELALLRLEPVAETVVASRLATQRRPGQGDPVLVIGRSGGRPVAAPGRILVPEWPGRIAYGGYSFDKAIKLAVDVEPGFSGGPVFDEHGNLIGILASFVVGDTGRVPYVSPRLAYAVPASSIAEYLSRALPSPRKVRPEQDDNRAGSMASRACYRSP